MASLNLKLGQTIETKDGRQGVVRYIGELHIADGDWLGLELPDASGKNDGSVKGERYFSCQPNHGIFVRKEAVVKVTKQAAPAANTRQEAHATAPGAGGKPRPGSMISADVARKRQSLMSPASAATVTAGSRLSMRSPTKSPMKAPSVAPSTANTSATSTPRTSTPATTARTSDSSTKSRTSAISRSSIAPAANTSRTTVHASRTSLSASATKATRPSSINSKASLAARRTVAQTKVPPRQPVAGSDANVEDGGRSEARTSQLENGGSHEGDDYDFAADTNGNTAEDQEDRADSAPGNANVPARTVTVREDSARTTRPQSQSQTANANMVESRAAQVRELEQLKAKIRTLEKQRAEDREKLEESEALTGENDRYKNIIQALQSKLKGAQQDMAELRAEHVEFQQRAPTQPERSGEQESELELATLDKEMAEEKAEAYRIELEALRAKQEELELELEILREENQELGSVMSPEEKAGAGWLQMERENQRLRDALVLLRDMTLQTEGDLKTEIKELHEHLDEAETTAAKYADTAQKLSTSEETNRHLVEQLEAIESNDEVVIAMEAQREQQLQKIEQLKKQVQEFEEHIQVTDELENFHLEEERRMHAQLDETEALLNESTRQNLDQDRVIEDLEYTLTKFRDVVQGLQGDIDELRRSRDISEIQANEMSSKSRAMMDLNLRLQSNAAKIQSKTIDSELERVRADLGAKHAEIISLYTMESYESERNSIQTLLCFGRLQAKAELISKLLGERLRERAHLSPGEEIFRIFEVIERFQWIASICERFDRFMSSCNTDDFASCGTALHEIEPVERVATAWLEAMRRDELGTDGPDHLMRMQGVLTDLAEKFIVEDNGTKASEILVQAGMVEHFADSIAGQTAALMRVVQSKLGGPVDDDEESLVFDKKFDQLTTKARTVKYLAGKIVQQLVDLRANCTCLEETCWILFEDVTKQADVLSRLLRKVGTSIAEDLAKFDPDQSMTYTTILEAMTVILQDFQAQNGNVSDRYGESDAFELLTMRLNDLQAAIDDLSMKTSDASNAVEFEPKTAPWILRSRYLKSLKVIPPETQEEMTRLERRSQELGSRLLEKEKTIEEMNMRVELAEKRMKDSRARDDKDKAHQDEVEKLQAERKEAERELVDLRSEVQFHTQKSEQALQELESLRKITNGETIPIPGTPGLVDDRAMKQIQLEANLLQAEITALQAAVRFLREENYNLRVPATEIMIEAARSTWLEPSLTTGNHRRSRQHHTSRQKQLQREAHDIYSDLIDVASSLHPIKLAPRGSHVINDSQAVKAVGGSGLFKSQWQATSQTTRYAILQQREEFEKWNARKSEFTSQAKITQKSLRLKAISANPSRQHFTSQIPTEDGSNLTAVPENGTITKHSAASGDPDIDAVVSTPGGLHIVET